MIISGVLIRTDDEAALAGLRPQLAAEERVTLGPSAGGTQAAALAFRDFEEGESLHEWLLSLPGVRVVDVVRAEYLERPPAAARRAEEAMT